MKTYLASLTMLNATFLAILKHCVDMWCFKYLDEKIINRNRKTWYESNKLLTSKHAKMDLNLTFKSLTSEFCWSQHHESISKVNQRISFWCAAWILSSSFYIFLIWFHLRTVSKVEIQLANCLAWLKETYPDYSMYCVHID